MSLQNIEIAEWFVKVYYKEVIDFLMNPLNIYSYDVGYGPETVDRKKYIKP